MRWTLLLSSLLAFLALPSFATAIDCRRCEGSGVQACRRCSKDPCSADGTFVLCSQAAACRDCAGAGASDCERCEAPHQVDLQARKDALSTWLARARTVDAFMDKELLHAASEHFELTWDVRKIDVGKGKPHAAMHIYLARLDALKARFQGDLGASAEDFSAPVRVLVWSRKSDQEKASQEYTQQASSTESKLMGAAPVVSIFYDKGHLHEEFELHQALVHQVVHCLLSNVFDGIWPGNIHGGWLDEGLAHLYETSMFGGVRHYCYVESDSIAYFRYGKWEPAVRNAVDAGEALGVLSVTGLNTVEMTPEQRMFSWALCDYFLRAEPGSLGPLARAVKAKKPFKDALEEVLEISPFELEPRWQAWIQANYSKKKRGR